MLYPPTVADGASLLPDSDALGITFCTIAHLLPQLRRSLVFDFLFKGLYVPERERI
ncbi:hypothetical protein [Nostoc sp.]|uniref:hypothetical protein n=1 Tax=Nostoc sp. TaxID=1180 RepID=UPI002D79FC75|nr:hypothetical protein [Nostoc sp.]